MGATRPSLEYLATCSEMSLESVELSRLNLAANLRKQFEEILEEWIDSEVDARLARAVLEWRRTQDSGVKPVKWRPAAPQPCEQLAMAFLPDAAVGTAHVVTQGGSSASTEEVGSGYVATVWQTRSASQIEKADREKPLLLSRASLPHPADEDRQPACQSWNSSRARSDGSTSLARAAAVRGAVENLVERRSVPSIAYPKHAERRTASAEPARNVASTARPLGTLVAVAPPIPEDCCQLIGFVPMNATGKTVGATAQVEDGARAPAMRCGFRSAQSI